MSRKLFKYRLREIALPLRRLSRLFIPILLAGLALTLFLAGPGFAETTTETLQIENGTVEITRTGDHIIKIVEKTTDKEFHLQNETELYYDENGHCKMEKSRTEAFKNGHLDRIYKREYHYDSQGREVRLDNYDIRYSLTESGVIVKKGEHHYTDTYTWEDGTALLHHFEVDEMSGQLIVDVPPYRMESHDYDNKPDSSKKKYEKVLEKVAAWQRKKFFGQAPPTTPAPSTVPGIPAAPAEFAATTARLLKGGYVELNLGVGFTSAASFNPSFGEHFVFDNGRTRDQVDSAGKMSFPGNVTPAVVGGIKIGHYGCPFSSHPLLDYFGWNLDLSYQRYSLSTQAGTFQRTIWLNGNVFSQGMGTATLRGDGSLFTLAFMVNARYGFLPSPENPFGTLQPFVGVGPALVVNRFEPNISFTSFNGRQVEGGFDLGAQTSVNVGLAAEAGVRYFATQHVFLDLSYRYLYSQPDFTFTTNSAMMKFNNCINNSSVRFGVGYAF